MQLLQYLHTNIPRRLWAVLMRLSHATTIFVSYCSIDKFPQRQTLIIDIQEFTEFLASFWISTTIYQLGFQAVEKEFTFFLIVRKKTFTTPLHYTLGKLWKIILRDTHTCTFCARSGTGKEPWKKPWVLQHTNKPFFCSRLHTYAAQLLLSAVWHDTVGWDYATVPAYKLHILLT